MILDRRLAIVLLTVVAAAACGGGGGGGGGTAEVRPSVSITADPLVVDQGGRSTLSWTTQDAVNCEASGDWTGVRPLSGTLLVGPLQATSVFTLTCVGPGGSDQASVTVSVNVPPPTVVLTADPASVGPGEGSTLRWNADNATACEASGGWSGPRQVSGLEVVNPAAPSETYTLRCTGAGGSGEASVTVAVVEAEPTLTFTASPTSVRSGASATLNWLSTNASGCEASGDWTGSRAPSGTELTPPLPSAATFVLSCQGSGGQVTRSVTVRVNELSGTILLSAISRSDSDVNDPAAPYADNGSLLTAQPLPNPVILGGYVNEPGRGPDGRSFLGGDLDDVFFVTLAAGQVIELVMPSADPTLPDSERDDADLGLYDANGNLLDQSAGLGQVEQLIAPANGNYYVRVNAFSGAPLYRLSIGQSGAAAASDSPRLSDDFVPGELVLLPRGADKVAAAFDDGAAGLAQRHGLRHKAGTPGREMLYTLPSSAGAQVSTLEKALRRESGSEGLSVPPALRPKWETLQVLKRLRADPSAPPVVLNRVLRAQAIPDDPLYAIQRWHYEMIQFPAARDLVVGDAGVVIAVVDSGVVTAHPDLAANLFDGYDFVLDPQNGDGDGIDADPDDPGCALGGSSIFHGTHVAGTVSAVTDNATGGAGVAGNALVMPIRVLDGCEGTGTFYDILQGIRYAAGLENDSGLLPARRADVINLSLGGTGACDPGLSLFFDGIRAEGVSVVAAAGNDGTSATSIPAACPGVLSVAAVDPNRERAYYSNFGESWVDLAAPGGDLRVDINGDGRPDGILSTDASGSGDTRTPAYTIRQGTSMAAPHVAGVLGLMKAVNPSLTPGEVETLLAQGQLTDDIGPAGPDALGVGLINAFKAVRAAAGDVTPLPPSLTVTPRSLNFGSVGTQAQVVAANGGTGTLSVTAVTASDPWIQVVPGNVDADGLGAYQIGVDRTALASGVYEGWVDFDSSANGVRVPVTMQVSQATGEPSTGLQYVLLADSSTFATAGQVIVLASGESVPYVFDSLDSGRYFVVAGTDMNNDGFICDDGEACGAYPVENDPTEIDVNGPVSGIDFASLFRTSVLSGADASGGRQGRTRGFRRLD